ncbi:MAG: SufD family Fe-S cluster assembly protein [bacterium]
MKTTQKFNQPEKYEITIPFSVVGESKEWVGVVDARKPGEYEIRVVADHRVKETGGKVTIRAVAGKDANVKLYGLIKIRKEAQQTNDFLELRVLTLDPMASGVVEPVLEIEANDVVASHAASVGPVNEEQVLYLMSRGLSRPQAEEEIVEGFLTGE